MGEGMEKLTAYIPRSWKYKLYRIAEAGGYRSVSELVRDIIRDYLSRAEG